MKTRPTSPLLRTLDGLLEGKAGSWAINLIVIPLLVVLAIVLPPLALPQRVLSAGYSAISPAGGSISTNDGAQLAIAAGTTKTGVNIRLDMQTRDAFLKSSVAQDLPAALDVKSPAYQPKLQGQMPSQAILSVPLPDGADPFTTLDVYGYNGKKWVKIPFQLYVDEMRVEAYLTSVIPQSVVVVQTGAQAPTISADLSAKTVLPSQSTPLLAEVNPIGLTIADGGGVAGSVPELPEASASSPYQVLPTVTDFDGDSFRGDLVDQMITTPDLRKQHIQTLVDLAVEKLYPGLNIDYQGMDPANQKSFTTFVVELAQALHAKDKILSVTMSLPDQISLDTWNTDAFDWMAIGQVADVVKLPLPTTRDSYTGDASSPVNQYLEWAVGRVDRYKLQLTFSTLGRDEFGSTYAPISFANAFKLVGVPDLPATVMPNTKVTFDLPLLRNGGIKSDAVTGLFYFNYKDDKGLDHTVYIESADSLSKKMALALQYNLRGIALRDVAADAVDVRMWDALAQYRDSKAVAYKSKPSISWRVNGQVVGKVTGTDPRFPWTSPAQGGDVKIDVGISLDDTQPPVSTSSVASLQVVKPTPTPAPTPVPVVVVAQPTAKPAAQPAVPVSAFRGKNMFGYGVQVNGGDPNGEAADIKSLGFNWVKVQMPWKDVESSSKGSYNWGSYDNFVGAMSGNGINVLLSIVKAPDWSRRQYGNPGEGPPDNMQDAADFMGAAAARYCGKVGAIEVWNEENLDVEWHDKRGLSAQLYMDMLKRAYGAIKAACPSIVVVSGAPTPTGGGGSTAIEDNVYLTQLYNNGLRNYCDAVGAHPSGFRSSPLVTMATPGALGPYADHHSFFFQDTMRLYRAVMVQFSDADKQIWPTEFGWPVGTGGGAHPAGQFNTADAVANYYPQAFQWAKQQGWVGPMFAWQWDFGRSGEVGAFAIKGSPTEGKLRDMAK